MKITKKKIVYIVLELFFMGVVPLALVIWNYSSIGNSVKAVKFKIGMTGVMLVILILLCLKKIFLDRLKERLFQQENNLISDLRIENDEGKIKNIIRELKGIRTLQTIMACLLPTLFFALLFIVCKGLEARLIELSGVVGLTAISYVIGTVFGVLAAREIQSKNIPKETKKT